MLLESHYKYFLDCFSLDCLVRLPSQQCPECKTPFELPVPVNMHAVVKAKAMPPPVAEYRIVDTVNGEKVGGARGM